MLEKMFEELDKFEYGSPEQDEIVEEYRKAVSDLTFDMLKKIGYKML